MPKALINVTVFIIFIGVAYWAYTLTPNIKEIILPQGLDHCLIESDCAIFGETGDSNCGCYNKDYLPSEVDENGFCLTPVSCECIDYKCEGVFGKINNFNDCINGGYSVMESYPRQCRVLDKSFTENYCAKKGTDDILTFFDAQKIAINSECGDNLKDTFICNEITGTYWIDLTLEKEGCSPACVIDIENRTADINWRCTGLIQ